jgi:hypothetical protein
MEFKKCCGYKGKCYHSDDMIVPVHMFGNLAANEDGLHRYCKACDAESNKVSNPMRPIVYKMAGSSAKFYALPKEDRKALRAEAMLEMTGEVIPMPKRSTKPRFDNGEPPQPRKPGENKGGKKGKGVEEGPGWVYIRTDDLWRPGLVKIGHEQDEYGRSKACMSWGFFRRPFALWFETRIKAETDVHEILDYCRLVSNREIFEVDLLEAQVAIETVSIRHKLNEGKTSTTGA